MTLVTIVGVQLTFFVAAVLVINGLRSMLSAILDAHQTERETWKAERQQLLDRIQAPDFNHLKHHEVKVIEAQKEKKEQLKLEPL